jgi:metalloendopeptidase OMA1, mitochondrial
MGAMRVAVFSLSAALLGVLIPGAELTAQTIPDRELFGKSQEVAQKALDAWGEWDAPEVRARVAEIGYRVARHVDREEGLPLSFYLIDMPVPNAFALPGGQIFLTRGMIDLELDDDMLAALLGHEIAHVGLDHHGRMNKRATLVSILSNALAVGIMVAASNNSDQYRDPYYTGPIRNPHNPTHQGPSGGQVVTGAAAASLVLGEVLLRSFSREHEDEADEAGQRWAANAGFDPGGTRALMARMSARMPQIKQYGYLQTHPFLDDRVRAAEARGDGLKRQTPKDIDGLRQGTQKALLAFLEGKHELSPAAVRGLEDAAYYAWPRGAIAGGLRLKRLREARETLLAKLASERDYGQLLRRYAAEAEAVRRLDPESPALATIEEERVQLAKERDGQYPQAQALLAGGVYQTSFLEVFVSNWPQAAEFGTAALALGDAYARRQQPTEAVEQYLAVLHAGPDSDPGRRAREGLRFLAPVLKSLSALQTLAADDTDPELQTLARTRLASLVATFESLDNGADYLKKFPAGTHVAAVTDRQNALATTLYNEVTLYQAVGESVKALEGIRTILTYAPLSPAAERLRDQAVLEDS